MGSESLHDKKYISGLYGARGYEFEITYILTQLPNWLTSDELDYLQQELWSDLELFFKSGGRQLIQIKNHQLELTEFREVIREFQNRQKDRPERYERFIIISTGESSSVKEIVNFIKRWKDVSHLGEAELATTRNKFRDKLQEYNFEEFQDFLIDNAEKIQIESEYGWVNDENLVRNIVVSSLTVEHKISHKDAENTFFRIARLLTSARGKRLDFSILRNELTRTNELSEPTSDANNYNIISTINFQPPTPQFFFGREEEIAKLTNAIQHFNILIVGGISGIGKTYLVAECVQRQVGKFPVFWLDCERFTNLEQFLAQLASVFSTRFNNSELSNLLREPNVTEAQRISAAISILDEKSCILVWDGFSQFINKTFLPFIEICSRDLKQGRLFITTREWSDPNNLFNPTYCLPPLSRLDKDAGLRLMQELCPRSQNQEILAQAYERVAGHPKFLTLLAGLSKSFPLSDLLNELPFVTEQVHSYIQAKIFNTLEPASKSLLKKLSALTAPFRISVVKYLMTVPRGYEVFSALTNRFLITLQSQEHPFYEIHDLVREFSRSQITEEEFPVLHTQLYEYFKDLPQRTFLDQQAAIYHALNAGRLDEAKAETQLLLYSALFKGYYNLTQYYIYWILSHEQAQKWGFVYQILGRILRVKENFTEAIAAYEAALKFALTEEDAEAAKFEIASTLMFLKFENDAVNADLAKQYFGELSESSDLNIKVQALNSLCLLKLRDGDEQCVTEMDALLALAEKSGSKINDHQVCYGLGQAYISLRRDYKRAIQYFERSRAIQLEIRGEGGFLALPWYFTNYALAQAYGNDRRIAEAVRTWRLCVDIDRKLKLEKRLAKSLHMLGRELCKQGNYSEAREVLSESFTLIEKYKLQQGERRSHFEWMTAALWNLGEYEKAVECNMDYVLQTDLDGVKHNFLPVVTASDLTPGTDLVEAREEGAILLVIPPPYGLKDYSNWVKNTIRRRPELAYLDIGDPREHITHSPSKVDAPKMGRNEQCPCGSGKKYKKCCMKR
jgi:tetratricopeptide (TPR) repeat protein